MFLLIIIQILFGIINNSDNFPFNLYYTHALSLINGNNFIIHKNGAMVFNYNLSIILYNYDFNGEILIPSEKENNLTSLIQCSDDINHYVLAMIFDKIYVFSSRGQFLFQISNDFFLECSFEGLIFFSYSLLFYKYDNSNYYFILAFANNVQNIKIIYFEIDMISKFLRREKDFVHQINDSISDAISCQIVNTNVEADPQSFAILARG